MAVKKSRLIRDLRKQVSNGEIRDIVLRRIKDFEEAGRDRRKIFSELCFCILTANYSAEGGLRVQRALEDSFRKLDAARLAHSLRKLGYRYPNTRAKYIVEARRKYGRVLNILRSGRDSVKIRRWLADNVPGLGFKEASHFLRNIGFKNLAIVDKHVARVLNRYGLIKSIPRTITRKKYLEIEESLRKVASELDVSLAELDLYLWYMDTRKILK
ncbi:MAG: N-glycosylase/DNA lyase [Thermoproteota archaeon]